MFQRPQVILVSAMLHKARSVSSLSAHRLGPIALQSLTQPSNPLSHSLYQLRSSQVLLTHALQLQLTQFHITRDFPSCLRMKPQQYCGNKYEVHPLSVWFLPKDHSASLATLVLLGVPALDLWNPPSRLLIGPRSFISRCFAPPPHPP